jgi:glutathione synthase/RimK-type ligase-like ATP-grasp enzyme
MGGKVDGFIDVVTCADTCKKIVHLSLSDIHIAWYLRESPNNSMPPDCLENRFSENESRAALRSLFSVIDCVWVNKKETIDFLSSNKLYQQLVAERCGLLTPQTLVSNDPETVASFSERKKKLLLK